MTSKEGFIEAMMPVHIDYTRENEIEYVQDSLSLTSGLVTRLSELDLWF